MRDFFSMDGAVFQFLSKMADMLILNILFIICCLPVFTIGAAVTALFYVTLKMKDGEEGYVYKSFFRSFKQNFRQSTVIWLILLVLALIMGMDFNLIKAMEGNMHQVMLILLCMGVVIWLMIFLYVFPLQARFYNTIRGTFRNAILLALASFPKTFCMMAVLVGSVLLTFLTQATFMYGFLIWFMFGFAVIAWINSQFLYGTFQKIMPKEEAEGTEKSDNKEQ